MTKDEALTLALEALEACIDYIAPYTHHIQGEEDADTAEEAITAIKEALAQPEQEPVGFAVMERPWVGLTEVDILAESKHWRNPEDFRCGVYWAADTLKEKNT